MQNQMMDMRLRQVENQMMQFMCLNTAITTQMMVVSKTIWEIFLIQKNHPIDNKCGTTNNIK